MGDNKTLIAGGIGTAFTIADMGDNQTLIAGGVGTAFSIVLFVVYRFLIPLFNATNHKRIRSVCCGRNCTTSMDVEDTTPPVVVQPIVSPTPLAALVTRTIPRD